MGIPGLEKYMWEHHGCTLDVSIENLVQQTGKNIVVVDGMQFYGLFIYPKFNWKWGELKRLEETVWDFVTSFLRIGVNLEFFFTEGFLDEGPDCIGSETWIKRRKDFLKFNDALFSDWSRHDNKLPPSDRWSRYSNNPITNRPYYYTPMHVITEIIHILRNILKCKVHFQHNGSRADSIGDYMKKTDCLAFLGQDNFYLFYTGIPRYLSLRNLELNTMTTKQYSVETVTRYLDLEGIFYPFTAEKALGNSNFCGKEVLIRISNKIKEYNSITDMKEIVFRFLVMKTIKVFKIEDVPFDPELQNLCIRFCSDVMRYNLGMPKLKKKEGPLMKWQFTIRRSKELYEEGEMSIRIFQILSSKTFFNYIILEDFKELPPSSYVYQVMRKKLYSILFHEEPEHNCDIDSDCDSDSDSDSHCDGDHDDDCHHSHHKEIKEWCITSSGLHACYTEIEPMDPALHPGLFVLWDFQNQNTDIQNKKWELFAQCISPQLNVNLFQTLPATLIVPTAVLFYLYNEVPKQWEQKHDVFRGRFLQAWEVEVFIAVAVLLHNTNLDFFSRPVLAPKPNTRIVNLIATFVYGCQLVRLLVEGCGYPINENDVFLSHYFDGSLYNFLYEKASWRRSGEHLCDENSRNMFSRIKNIIFLT